MSSRPTLRWTGSSVVPLEAAVTVLMAATAYGFLRLFDTTEVLVPLVAAVLGSQAVVVVGRRLRLPVLVSALVSAAALLVVAANWAVPESTVRYLPTRATGPALLQVARDGVEAFENQRAPAPDLIPFVLGAFVALWIATFLTDWAAVRLRLAFETVLPAGGLFLFCALLGSGQHQVASTLAFAGAVALYAVVQRTVNQARRATWLAVERSRGIRTVARSGLALGAVAVLAGLVVGPRLPGADSDELWSWRGRGDGTRVVVSPFVTIESRLVQQADTEMFRVTASEPSYWRTAGLDVYSDGVWQIRRRFSRQDGRLPGDRPAAGTVALVEQRYELSGLADIWLPAAYAPSRIVEADGPVTWNEATSTLSVDRDRSENTGATYALESMVPRYTAEELRAADPVVPSGMADDFVALPDDVSPWVRDLAEQVTAGQPTRFDQLRALQDWFLTEFTYSTSLPPRQGDPIEQFLSERVGFCQQFAGTFAVMARSLGAPARVAVGFTWGEPDPEDPSTYLVTGRHAHAWPEVWFAGLGWVPFEPTPGRGAPGAEAWTGLPASQDGSLADGTPADDPAAGSADSALPDMPDFGPLIPEDFLGGAELGDGEGAGGTAGDGGGALQAPPAPVLAAMGLAASWFIGVPLFDGLARLRRRTRSRTPAEQVQVAWRGATDELALLDLRRYPWETRLEFARRASADRRLAVQTPVQLAELVTAARFHPTGVAPAVAAEAEAGGRELTRLVHRRVPLVRRYLRQVDPRPRVQRLTAR
jgi:transglutaminase-like putative cysteine protease